MEVSQYVTKIIQKKILTCSQPVLLPKNHGDNDHKHDDHEEEQHEECHDHGDEDLEK